MNQPEKIFFWGINSISLTIIGFGILGLSSLINISKSVALDMILLSAIVPVFSIMWFGCLGVYTLLKKLFK